MMKILRSLILMGIAIGTMLAGAKAQEGSQRIENASIFRDGEWRTGRALHLKEGRIQRIETGSYEGASAPGPKILLPPLVNAHVHLWKPFALQKALGCGIFALLDMHTSDRMAQRMRGYNDSLRYARYHSSNAGATVPNGHGTQFGIQVPTIDSSTDPETFVMDRIEAGADYIKILREPSMPTIDLEQTQRVIELAHREDMQVIAHVSRKEDAVALVEQGVDGLAHVWHDERIEEEALEAMAEQEVFVIPTLLVIQKVMEQKEKSEGEERLSFEAVQEEVERLHEAGVPILAGTDPPNAGIDYSDDLFEEMRLLHEAGLSVKEVLKSATTNVYEQFPFLPYGIEPEKKASFLVLEEKPGSSFAIRDRLERIRKNGRSIDPEELPAPGSSGSASSASGSEEQGKGSITLDVRVDRLRSNEGSALMELKNAEEEKIASRKCAIEEKRSTASFDELPKGAYAVGVIHDENGNGEFDQDEKYRPEEGWGYSQNVKGNMGPPPFKERLVEVEADTSIAIHMNYMGE